MNEGYIVFGVLTTILLFSFINSYLSGIMEKKLGTTYGGWVILAVTGPVGTILIGLFLLCFMFENRTIGNPWLWLKDKGQ